MSNPFDMFAADVSAALPGGPPPAPEGYTPYPPPSSAGPTQQPMSVMNSPPQQTYPSYGQAPGGYGQPAYGAPPPQPAYGAPPPPGGNPYGMPEQPPPDQNPYGQQLVPAALQSNPYAMPPGPPPQMNGYVPGPPADAGNPFGAPAGPPPDVGNPFGAPVGPPPDSGNPFGAPPAGPPPDAGNPFGAPPGVGNPYGAPPPGPPPDMPPLPPSNDPWGAPPQPPQHDPYAGALVPANQGGVDPFSVFNSAPPPAPMPPPPNPYGGPPPEPHRALPPSNMYGPPPGAGGTDDFFGEMGFSPPPGNQPTNSDGIFDKAIVVTEPGQKTESDLPPGGEWYDARIFTPTLGVMFFKPKELTDSLFLNTDRDLVDALGERPVVAFIVEGSSARSAGVELGHVLLKVNGVDVKNPKEASRLIKEGPRPLPLLFYVPNTEVVVAEGEHMVKYDTKDTTAPNSAKDWKPKYVVIGGIIAQPWMINMYRSKSEYDIAVIETQARRPVSVKVKQFSLQGARIQNDWQGPQMVKYKNKLHPWKYIVILPVARNPIKISSPNLSQLKPVHEGIRRVLLSQQRDRGSNPNTAAPVRSSDPYARNGQSGPPPDAYSRATSGSTSGQSTPAPPPPPPPTQDLLGGFDDPPPQSYGGPPPPQYGAPPPQYGGPPPPQYGGPPPQYGAPPPQYGAPPPQPQYGAPPPPQHYGGPPPNYVQQPYNNY